MKIGHKKCTICGYELVPTLSNTHKNDKNDNDATTMCWTIRMLDYKEAGAQSFIAAKAVVDALCVAMVVQHEEHDKIRGADRPLK